MSSVDLLRRIARSLQKSFDNEGCYAPGLGLLLLYIFLSAA